LLSFSSVLELPTFPFMTKLVWILITLTSYDLVTKITWFNITKTTSFSRQLLSVYDSPKISILIPLVALECTLRVLLMEYGQMIRL
jgi:hypothetical protein